MNEIPSMWRTELLHPQFVHFTVALLMFGSLLWLLALVLPASKKPFFRNAGQLLVITGTVISWLTIYTGDLADAEVGRTLCDPTVLESHEYHAYTMAWFFTGISALFTILSFTRLLSRFQKWIRLLVLLLMVAGNAYLIFTAHEGAKVVYQQSGGVYQPSEDCSKFE